MSCELIGWDCDWIGIRFTAVCGRAEPVTSSSTDCGELQKTDAGIPGIIGVASARYFFFLIQSKLTIKQYLKWSKSVKKFGFWVQYFKKSQFFPENWGFSSTIFSVRSKWVTILVFYVEFKKKSIFLSISFTFQVKNWVSINFFLIIGQN